MIMTHTIKNLNLETLFVEDMKECFINEFSDGNKLITINDLDENGLPEKYDLFTDEDTGTEFFVIIYKMSDIYDANEVLAYLDYNVECIDLDGNVINSIYSAEYYDIKVFIDDIVSTRD